MLSIRIENNTPALKVDFRLPMGTLSSPPRAPLTGLLWAGPQGNVRLPMGTLSLPPPEPL